LHDGCSGTSNFQLKNTGLRMLEDKQLTCRQCGKEFVFTKGEQEFYLRKGLSLPSRCPKCRPAKHIQPPPLICSQCKSELDRDASIYCTVCLAAAHLESEIEIKQSQKLADEAQSMLQEIKTEKVNLTEVLRQKERVIEQLKEDIDSLSQDLMEANEVRSKLRNSESEKANLAKALSQKEQTIVELESRTRSLGQDLEEVRQFHADLQWIHPALDGIRERLEALEHGQNKINQRMLQVVERIHYLYENPGILGIIKRAFGRYPNQAATQNEPLPEK